MSVSDRTPLIHARGLTKHFERLTGWRARVTPSRVELAFADEHELAELVEALENAASRT